MKGKRLFKLLGAIALAAVIAIPFAAGCAAPEPVPGPPGPAGPAGAPGTPGAPAPAPAPAPTRPITVISGLATAFGSSTYCVMAGVESLFADHPWVRFVNTETPGAIWNILKVMKDVEARKDSILSASPVEFSLALRGVEPYVDQAYPEAANMKLLLSFNCGLISFVTLDKNLVDPKTWEGKRIGTGREPQTWWTQIPKALLDLGYEITPKYSYLGLEEAVNALLDGKADVIVLGGYGSLDLQKTLPHDTLLMLAASGRDFYWAELDADIIESVAGQTELGFTRVHVPANSLPNQPKPIEVMSKAATWSVHSDFPEELAYEFVKVMVERYEELYDYHALATLLTPGGFASGFPEEAFHPGAIKAYKEAGITIHE